MKDYNKLRGGYYTPREISEFITNWAVFDASESVLEPSCGDGGFIEALTNHYKKLGATDEQIKSSVLGIEQDEIEAEKASRYGATITCSDFFDYYQNNIDGRAKFDVIIGNPPYIRYHDFKEEQRKIAFDLMKEYGFRPNRLTNIWIPFLVLSCKALKPNGRLGMVLPAELFYVDYASETREFLNHFFDRLTIITFKRLVFDDIQQNVVLLLGERGCEDGVRFIELDGLSDLAIRGMEALDEAELIEPCNQWMEYYLTNREINLLKRLDRNSRISNASELFEVNIGLVSGRNEFFIMNKSEVNRLGLEKSVAPIISQSKQVKGINLTDEDYKNLVELDKNVFFFAPENKDFDDLLDEEKSYIRLGEKKGFDTNYKCRIRPRWYYVSQSWHAEAFMLCNAHLYPRMILNKREMLVTDNLYKVRFLEGIDGSLVTAAFLNTYTLAISELIGRGCSSGLLALTPSAIRQLRIPMQMAERLDFQKIDDWQRKGEIDKILEYTDSVLLREGLGLNDDEIKMLRDIWDKLRNRRLNRNKK